MKKIQIILLTIGFLITTSCTSMANYKNVDALYQSDEPAMALELLLTDKENFISNGGQIVYGLNAGVIAHNSKQFDLSNQMLSSAENGIEESYTESITANIGSYLVSENTRAYQSPSYEDIYCSLFKALNYYHLGDLEGSMVEIRRMNEKINYYVLNNPEINDERVNYNRYRNNIYPPLSTSALGHFLAAIISYNDNDQNYFEVSKKKLEDSLDKQSYFYYKDSYKLVDDIKNLDSNLSYLSTLAFSGLAPIKKSVRDNNLLLKDSYYDEEGNYHSSISGTLVYSFPQKRRSKVEKVELIVDRQIFILEPFEDIGKVAYSSMLEKSKAEYTRAFIRLLTRELSKTVVEENEKKSKKNKDSKESFSQLFSFGMDVFSLFSEQADLRCSLYFPSLSYVNFIPISPGKHNIEINYLSKNNSLIKSVEFKNYNIEQGKISLIETYCID